MGLRDALSREAFQARENLKVLLPLAYSGELAAARAYAGHRASLRDATERRELWRITKEELEHRQCILRMMGELGLSPDPRRERKMNAVGKAISLFCLVGGWFFPMWGAGKLEAQNIREYELAARLCHVAGLTHFEEPFLDMAEVEWDHELYFRSKAQSHWMWRLMPKWQVPPPRGEIRATFTAFVARPVGLPRQLHVPWLVR